MNLIHTHLRYHALGMLLVVALLHPVGNYAAPHALPNSQATATPAPVYIPVALRPGATTVTPAPTTPPAPLPPPTTNVLWVSPSGLDQPSRGSESAPLKTVAYACERAQAGETIRLRAGEFRETAQCVLRSGVRLTGNGRSGANRTIVYAPANWNFSADGVEDNPGGYIVRLDNVENVTVDQIEFRGNANKANGAVLANNTKEITLRDLNVYDFRYTGLQFQRSSQIDAQNIYIENSGYEWTPGTSSTFPDGGSVGNLGIHDVQDAVFGFVTIKTTALRGYGVKASNLSRVRFHNFDCDMYPFQSWGGVGPNNFDMEIHGGYAELVEIAHSRFRQTLSLMGGNDARYDAVPYSIHVHHNMFDMKNGSYSVEVGTDKMVFDHNWFRGTWTALQNYGNETTRIRDLTVFNNVVENLSMRFVGLKGRIENLRVFGNTVYLGSGGGQSYLVTLGSNNESRNWLLANNAIVGSNGNAVANRQLAVAYETTTAPRDVQTRNNVYRDIGMNFYVGDAPADPAAWNHTYTNNFAADPALPTSGDNAFQPTASSPVIDRGDANIGIRNTFVGAGRDVGAFERGETGWRAGPNTTNDVTYLWAPTTSVKQSFFVDTIDVDLTSAAGTQIRYTLDGTEPGPKSTLYTGPIRVAQPVKLRARTFDGEFGSGTALSLDLNKGVQGYPNVGAQGTFSASSVYPEKESNGTDLYGPAKAFDGVTYSWVGWSPNGNDKRPWLQTDLGTGARIRYVELYTRAQVGNDPAARRNFEIRGSNDPTFATYTVLASQNNTALPFEGVFKAEVTDAGTYRFIRAAKTADESFFVTELRVLGER